MLYLGPDSEIDGDAHPVSSPALSAASSNCCCYFCGSPISQPRRRSRARQQLLTQVPQQRSDIQPAYHAYANLMRGTGSSTLPSVSRRTHHHQTAPVVFPGKAVSAARDVPDAQNRRGIFYTSSTVNFI